MSLQMAKTTTVPIQRVTRSWTKTSLATPGTAEKRSGRRNDPRRRAAATPGEIAWGWALVVLLAAVMLWVSVRLFASTSDATAPVLAAQATQEMNAMQRPPLAFEYFPARFREPTGEVEPLPPTF